MSIANNNTVARVAAVVAGLALVASSFAFAPAANAQSSASLEAQIAALMAQIAALQAQSGGSSSASMTFTRDLTLGSSGADVTALQNWLIANGASIPAGATGYFGAQTQAALAKWQASAGITPAAGYFGPITRAKVNASAGGSTGGNGGSTGGSGSGDLEGGAGEISEADFISSLSSEEVGEDEEDVEVAGLEIEADGSDINLVAVTVVFDEGSGATEDFDEYATEVSVWFDGEEVARVDAEEFEEDDDYSNTISLDEDAIIREGETGELTIAVSSQGNLDSDQTGDDWDVAFESVRFMDAQGATITDSSTGDIDDDVPPTVVRTFSFESFATAADVELHISEGDDDVNDARSLEIDESEVTDDVELLSFELEAEGDSEILIKDFGVNIVTTVGSSTAVISDLRLVIDGEEFDGDYQATTTDSDDWVFEDMDFTIDAGETVEAMIVADINGTDDFDETTTLTVGFDSDEEGLVDAEDESGEELTPSEITGSASAGAFTFGESGITVEAVSTDADANDNETVGTFEVVVDVTAFGDDLYIYDGADIDESATSGFVYSVYAGGNGTTTAAGTISDLVTSTADKVGNYYEIEEGETEQFTITVTVDPSAGNGGLYNVEIDTVHHKTVSTGAANSGDVDYTIPQSEDVETPAQNLVAS